MRLSVPWQADAGWPSHVVSSDLGSEGFKFGYYLPGGGGPVTIQAEALDAASCILGSGSLTLSAPPVGGTSPEMALFVRPLAAQMCVDAGSPPPPDGGIDAGGDGSGDGSGDGTMNDAGSDGASTDAGTTDGATDAATDGAADGAADGAGDGGTDAPATDAPGADATTNDAPAAG